MSNRYTDLITSEHANQPNYAEMMAFLTQFFVDQQNTLAQFNQAYDLDFAVGVQLDVLGLWIGVSRTVKVPISDETYFSLDIPGSGLDEKPWYVTGDPQFNAVILEDESYRALLKAKAAANNWDGTINGAYHVYDIFFRGTPTSIMIHDYQNMTYALEVTGVLPDVTTLAILSQDVLGLRPESVQLLPLILP